MDKQLTILLPNDVPLEMILVGPGYFTMGSEAEEAEERERPEHLVHIPQSFYIGKYPVTQLQWQAMMGNNPSHFPGAERPVENVSWKDIVEGNQDDDGTPAFLTLVNNCLAEEKPNLAATYTFRLPTEAEWEYAAKNGPCFALTELEIKKTAECYHAYVDSDRLETCGWFRNNNGVETRPVGLKNGNELGLYDMSGNVWEWCNDWFDRKTYKNRKEPVTISPAGPDRGILRVLRGGSSWNNAKLCRSACRRNNHSSYRRYSAGFRLALSRSLGSDTSG